MEAIFFGPPAGNPAKCSGSSSRITHARTIHKEICALLLGALESLRMNLCEFCTVLPAQWATLTGSTQAVSTAETEQRLNKLVDSAKVCLSCHPSHDTTTTLIISHNFLLYLRHSTMKMILRQRQTQMSHNCVQNAFCSGEEHSRLPTSQPCMHCLPKNITYCVWGDSQKASS